eukprot:CAMPEP_0113663682 /NCGR_PEP_ID=MMETSP0038_2-20120614/1296_1 /TAXON_ID=2898 /ORGANISM="Cryptomonas paramecium" /LENGTH=168 /DNA_ID=CAMNT_0000578773 /DNA_START=186 /DNA_END=689 /DNA_ORIENTATION=- /assembly_acc=CAM_ASM_000170
MNEDRTAVQISKTKGLKDFCIDHVVSVKMPLKPKSMKHKGSKIVLQRREVTSKDDGFDLASTTTVQYSDKSPQETQTSRSSDGEDFDTESKIQRNDTSGYEFGDSNGRPPQLSAITQGACNPAKPSSPSPQATHATKAVHQAAHSPIEDGGSDCCGEKGKEEDVEPTL